MKKLFIILPLFALNLKANDAFDQFVSDLDQLCQSTNKLFTAIQALGTSDFPITTEYKSPANASIVQEDNYIAITIQGITDKESTKAFYNEFDQNLRVIINSKDGKIQTKINNSYIEIEQMGDSKEEIKNESGVIQKVTSNAFHSRASQPLPTAVDLANYSIEESEQHVIIKLPIVTSAKK